MHEPIRRRVRDLVRSFTVLVEEKNSNGNAGIVSSAPATVNRGVRVKRRQGNGRIRLPCPARGRPTGRSDFRSGSAAEFRRRPGMDIQRARRERSFILKETTGPTSVPQPRPERTAFVASHSAVDRLGPQS